ncbi:glutathione synthase [Thiohalophilus sp.]|uniref:glutathione synthase n=1 Tax=Thiohalophilus sp. TaxID=3028392 RepID=UPI002ACEB579|nr:glutathione synthase [Thiohalophilus sp.]MDZ7661847.1 glutathione synthase [Thiohalophilus sp.]
MTIQLGVVMDPIGSINYKKDSTLAMLLAAARRGWQLQYMEQPDLYLDGSRPRARSRALQVYADPDHWYELGPAQEQSLDALDVILMRKDPPFDLDYLYSTHILELAEAGGALVVNKPQSLRDANEKLFTTWFPDCMPPTRVSSQPARIREFLNRHEDIIVKPLDSMGGSMVFRLQREGLNTGVILETMTQHGKRLIMAQRFVPEIREGDKRILLIDGEPVPYALARIPAAGETRANLAAGGRGSGVPLSERDYQICEQVAPVLRDKGLLFVGLDVIGDYLTEINVTSPTCIRELDELYQLNIADQLMQSIEQHLSSQ